MFKYSNKELGQILAAFVPANFSRREVSSDADIQIGDIVTKKKDNEQMTYVIYKSFMQGIIIKEAVLSLIYVVQKY